MPDSVHIPVLPSEVIDGLSIAAGQTIIDGTFGGGGHSRLIARQVGENGLVLGFDRDPEAIDRFTENSAAEEKTIRVFNASYTQIPHVLKELEQPPVNGILLDLGLSSDQLDDDERGFSYAVEGPLDLRFNPYEGEPAWKMIDRMSAEHLADVIYEFGEERLSRRIARAIVEQRKKKQPIRSSKELAEVISRCVPSSYRHGRIHPATRTFQALRIAVNDELKQLQSALRLLPDCLAVGGRIAIISFHSLEDRFVKNAFRNDTRLQAITKKPVLPSESEIMQNPRSRSAKLRIAERR